MISVVVYGRNDDYGYNLHKRTAIGLNAVAEQLTAPGDEILFVDYNSPDDYPTLVEAIRDTLTDCCLARLRVLRVRPRHHERFRGRTPYPVLEAIARNVAVRRMNPGNRWILSTNPDMIFVPRGRSALQPAASLSEIAAELPDGFYQLPRFELPESLWETFDRRDPAGTIARLSELGRRLHINEVVLTGPATRFDGIGDFQLILRDDYVVIHGCNEEMLVGSNVDMNLCLRLNRLRGETLSLLDQLFAFHCGHGRQATRVHADNTLMNDPIRYVDSVDDPHLPEQAGYWGLEGEPIEEFTGMALPSARYVPALESVLPGLADDYTETLNDTFAPFRLCYEPEHALPYAINHLVNLPPSSVIGYVGGNRRMLGLFRTAWRELGTGRLLIGTDVIKSAQDLDPDREVLVSLEQIGHEADVLVFEFGLDDALLTTKEPDPWFAQITPEVRDTLGRLKGAFQRLCDGERRRQRAGAAPRKVIAINAINTWAGVFVEADIQFLRIPFSCRVQHGFVRPDGPAVFLLRGVTELGGALEQKLGRRHGIDRYETAIVDSDLARVRDGDLEAIDPRVFSEPLLAALDWPQLDLTEERRAVIRKVAARRRISVTLRSELRPELVVALRPEGKPALCKIAAAEDWEDPDWFALAHRHTIEGLSYHASTYNYFKRSRGVWERTQLLYALADLDNGIADARVGVISGAPDGLPLFLADRAAHVDAVAAAPDRVGRQGAIDRATWLGKRRLFHSDFVTVHTGHDAPSLANARWQAILLPQGTAVRDGMDSLLVWLAWADARLQEGGVLAFSAEVALGTQVAPWMITLEAARALAAVLPAHTGLRPAGLFDWSLSDATLDRFASAGTPDTDKPHLVVRTGGALHTTGVWVLRKTGSTGVEGWRGTAVALGELTRDVLG